MFLLGSASSDRIARPIFRVLRLFLPIALLISSGAYFFYETVLSTVDTCVRLTESISVDFGKESIRQTFQTVNPMIETELFRGNNFSRRPSDERSYCRKVVAQLPRESLDAGARTLQNQVLALLVLLFVLTFTGCWKLVRTSDRRRLAEAEARQMKRNLERLVQERTAQLKAELTEKERTEAQMLIQSLALEASANAIIITDFETVIQWANPAFSKLTGYSLNEVIGKRPRDLLKSGLQDEAFYQSMWQTITGGQVWRGELVNKRKDGTLYHEAMTITPVGGQQGGITHFIAIKEDISLRKRLERRQLAQFELLEKSVGDRPLTALLDEVVHFIETQTGDWRCSILLADAARGILHLGAASSLSDAYNRLVEGLPIAEGCGSCGTAAARGKTVIVDDVRTDPLWAPYLDLISGEDWLRACWSMPIFDSKGRLLGTFAVYCPEPRSPSAGESELISFAVSLSSLLIERMQANSSLRQNEKKLANILDTVEAYIYIKNRDYRYQYVNRHVCDLFGLTLEDIVGKTDDAFFDAETSANLRENDRRILELGERIEIEETNAQKTTGEIRTYLSIKIPLKNENGDIYALCGVSTDITERKRTEEALRESEEKLHLFIEHAPAALAMFDHEMRYLAVSRRWLTDYGLKDDAKVLGRSHYEVFPEIPARWKKIHRRGLSGEIVKSDDDRFERFDGDVQWLRWEVRPWYTKVGVVGGIVIFTEDVTKRKEAEVALRESEHKFRQIFNHARDGIVLIDCNSGLIINCNAAFELQSGRTLAQLNQSRIWELRPPEKQPLVKELFQKTVATGTGESSDLELQQPNGTIVPVEIRWSIVTIGRERYIQSITRDISERKQAETRILNLNRVYKMLSNINQAIVRMREMEMLYRESCRIAVEDGGFRMAWIGIPDPGSRELRPVASAGMSKDYLADLRISLNGGELSNGPSGKAFRENRYVCCNDIEHDPCMIPWRNRALELGFRSSIAIPIKVKGRTRGVFNLYATQANFFNEDEIQLLEELTGDIAFALEVSDLDAEHRNSEAHLRQAAAVFDSTREGVMVTDAKQNIVMVNRAFTDLTGYSEAEVLGKNPSLLSSGRHDQNFYATIWANIKSSGHWQGEIWNRRKNGELYPELLSISSVMDDTDQITGYVGVFADISKLKASEAELEFLAHHDPLTGLPNRLLLLSRLDHGIDGARRESRQLALLMIDLDRFKDVNDSFGHLMGDELLRYVAKRLTDRLRSVDTVARLGGDEFTVLLDDIAHPEDAARVANEIIASLSEPWQLSNNAEVRIGASIGISLFPEHGNTAITLLQQADAALYQAKLEGRGRFKYFSEDLTRAAFERIHLETSLRSAINHNELKVFFQPQLEIATGLIIGAEALVRWQNPREGFVSPARFIPIAEETGLIGVIGEWVLNETCLQGRRWLEAGFPPMILAVNVSPYQFMNNDIASVVSNILARTGYPVSFLELELTESALMEREEESITMLNRLRAIGVRLAIDDFGTGYSSLSYLKRFPLDVLKIDKSFVDDIPENQDDMQIAATIIAIAHTLRLKVLAEGVETSEQLAFLKEQGCDFYQGYLKSPPVPAIEFERLLKDQMKKDALS